jgi:hypothetical protein
MRKAVLWIVALAAVFLCDCLGERAVADGVPVVHPRKVHHMHHGVVCVGRDRCGAPVGCPYATPCYSLYGRYGPYGGSQYWSRYSFGGWGW